MPVMMPEQPPFLATAWESLRGAEREYDAAAYNNCANRAYYACFQAAIAALQRERISPGGAQWSHTFVRAQFEGVVLYRRKRYSAALRGILEAAYDLRVQANYREKAVTRTESHRSLREARMFVEAVAAGGASRR